MAAKKKTAAKNAPKKAAAKKKASAEKATPKKAAAKKKASAPKKKGSSSKGSTSSAEVNLGHVFALRPRVNTSFRPNDFMTAKRALREESYSNLQEAARAVAEEALNLTRGDSTKIEKPLQLLLLLPDVGINLLLHVILRRWPHTNPPNTPCQLMAH